MGNNLVNVAMSDMATALAISFWGEKGIVYVTGVLTLVILIFAEIMPKVYAKYFNEQVSLMTAPILNGIMGLFAPVVTFVTFVTNRLLSLIGVDVTKMKRPLLTEDEVRTCIKMGWDEGAITAEERRMLSLVFTLNDKEIAEVMVPKSKMTVLDLNASVGEAVNLVLKTGYSRFPVTKGTRRNIVGFIHSKDLFRLTDDRRGISLNKIVRPPYFVSADQKIDVQLRSFQARKLHQAVALDSAGQVVGLITLEDILEELVGSIQDEHDY